MLEETAAFRSGGHGSGLLGVRIGQGSIDAIVERSLWALDHRAEPCTFACANPHSLVEAQRDPEFMRALDAAAVVVADGIGVSLVAALLGIPVGPRITGYEYFDGLMRAMNERGVGRVYFFGSTESTLQSIRAPFAVEYPALTLCGMYSPPFREMTPDENRIAIERIRAARADVLWVGMTAPKQERWVHAHAASLDVPVIGSVGAVFDFFAGSSPRAPDWMRRMGLEWAFRLAREPRRLWRRTFMSAPTFVRMALERHLFQAR
jgi:N-acetylglucosaminyldiphosphoundecaprenol N-acetyl-beta-D-mannosaminyltransferase